jgi:ATP-binding cassette subfamily A (ABC1) protein 3
MMCLDTPRTSGEAKVLNTPVEYIDVLQDGPYIGLCPQYNTLWEQLTVDESLNLVAKMKGLSNEDRQRNKRLILETLELGDFVDTRAGNLSGGNKRKLCCAQTLMVCPRVEFLDEPTTGVDPVSRRSLLRMVK